MSQSRENPGAENPGAEDPGAENPGAENPWVDLTRRWQEFFTEQSRQAADWWGAQTTAQTTTQPTAPGMADVEAMFLPLVGGSHVADLIRRVTHAPRLADVGEFERRTARLTELFLEVQAASRAYEARVAQGWADANQAFAQTMAQRVTDPQIAAPQASIRTWLACADDVFTRLHRSAEFLEAQRRVMRAGIDYLLAEREAFEAMVEPTGIPTRSEIDQLHQTVHQLRRRVRVLEKALEKDRAAPQPSVGEDPR